MDATARLSALLKMADAFQKSFDGHDLLAQMRDAEPRIVAWATRTAWDSHWCIAAHQALTPIVYRMIVVARTRQVAPSEEALNCALLWFAAVWGVIDWSAPRCEERRAGWPATVPHPFIPRPSKAKKEAA